MSSSSAGTSNVATNIAVAGLIFQVITLTVFCLLVADYTWRYRKGTRSDVSKTASTDTSTAHASAAHDGSLAPRTKTPPSFKIFATALALATALILIRCAYRIDELSQGYRGSDKITNQGLFIALEGVMVVLAAILLCVAHPGYGFKDIQSSVGGIEGEKVASRNEGRKRNWASRPWGAKGRKDSTRSEDVDVENVVVEK